MYECVKQCDHRVHEIARECAAASQLMPWTVVSEVTVAALVAMIGNAREFDSGHQLAAWLGWYSDKTAPAGETTRDFVYRGKNAP